MTSVEKVLTIIDASGERDASDPLPRSEAEQPVNSAGKQKDVQSISAELELGVAHLKFDVMELRQGLAQLQKEMSELQKGSSSLLEQVPHVHADLAAVGEYIRLEVAQQLASSMRQQDLPKQQQAKSKGQSKCSSESIAPFEREAAYIASGTSCENGSYTALRPVVDVDQQSEDAIVLPESLFGYCMAKLALEPDFFSAVLLVSMSLAQQILLLCLFDGFLVVHMSKGWKGAVESRGIYQCVFSQRTTPNIGMMGVEVTEQILASVVAILTASAHIKRDDTEILTAIYASSSSPFWARCLSNVGWFTHAMILPVTVALTTSGLMATSDTGMDVVLNSLAVVFILELDNFMFEHCLSDVLKLNYMGMGRLASIQGCRQVAVQKLHVLPRVFFMMNVFQMLLHWLSDLWADADLQGNRFLEEKLTLNSTHPSQTILAPMWLMMIVCRGALQSYAWTPQSQTRTINVKSAVVGLVYYVAVGFTYTGIWLSYLSLLGYFFTMPPFTDAWKFCLSRDSS